MPTLVLVDGSSYLYRAFHALPDLRTRAGEPTGALRGVSMLRRIVDDDKPDYFAVVFDAPGKTFRDALYPQYKANRPPMPDDLAAQIEPLHALVRAHGWPLVMIEGVEADDVIGTLAKQARAIGIDTTISSSDKDLAQLVEPGIVMINTMSNERLDEAGVIAKFGVRADQVLDYLTLIGDTVDNVPGVDKVGPKTAVKWIAEFGSLDAIVANAAGIGGKVGENCAPRSIGSRGPRAPDREDRLRVARRSGRPRDRRARQRNARRALRPLRVSQLAARGGRRQVGRRARGRRRRDRRARDQGRGHAPLRSRARRPRAARRRPTSRTRPCSTRRRSRAGSRRSSQRRSSRSTPRRRASIR
jgi:5'-3' exonuclease